MKKSIVALALLLSIGCVHADNLFQNNNPFPQTSPQTMNNIYESEPATIIKEQKAAKKSRIKNKITTEKDELNNAPKLPVYPVYHEGALDNGDYYIFTTGQ